MSGKNQEVEEEESLRKGEELKQWDGQKRGGGGEEVYLNVSWC